MADILAFPGVDPAMVSAEPAPNGRTLVVSGKSGEFTLAAEPGGPIAHPRFSTAAAARAHAGRLCFRYQRSYQRVFDRTGETYRLSIGELLAGMPFYDGGAA